MYSSANRRLTVQPTTETAAVVAWSLGAVDLEAWPELRLLGDDGVLLTLGLSTLRGEWHARDLRPGQTLWAVVMTGADLLVRSDRVRCRSRAAGLEYSWKDLPSLP